MREPHNEANLALHLYSLQTIVKHENYSFFFQAGFDQKEQKQFYKKLKNESEEVYFFYFCIPKFIEMFRFRK